MSGKKIRRFGWPKWMGGIVWIQANINKNYKSVFREATVDALIIK